MRDELENVLADEFPFMRRGVPAEDQTEHYGGDQSPYSAWELEMGDGWFQLIWDMCAEIAKLTTR